jgi:hypothetical protein
MQLEKIDLDEAHCFSGMFLDYIKGNESLKPFYENVPHIDHILMVSIDLTASSSGSIHLLDE